MDNSAVLSLFAPPKLDGIKKLLCVQPHPDDNEIGMGGIISLLTKKGVQVDYLTVTDGSLGDIGIPYGEESLANVRRRETEMAGKALGVTAFHYFSIADGTLADINGLSRRISELLRRERYDAVAAPDPWNNYEAHNDHVVTGKAVAAASISCNLKKYPENTETEPLNLSAVIFYFTSKPNTFFDITNEFERKMGAVSLHASQISPEMLQLYGGYFMWRGERMSGKEGVIMEGVKALLPLHLHCIPEAEGI